jgi:hypothetical protein
VGTTSCEIEGLPPAVLDGLGQTGARVYVQPMRTLSVVALFLLAGCESASDVIAKKKAGVEETFALIRALDAKVKATPAIEESRVKPTTIILERVEGSAKPSNAAFIYAEDVASPGDAKAVHLRTLDSAPLLHCGSLISKGQFFGDSVKKPSPSVTEQYLSACERLKYVLVIRLREFRPPELALEAKKFAPGEYKAEVLVFDLLGGEYLGGYLVNALNEPSVQLLDGDPDHVQKLISNLESETFTAIRDATRKWIPGSLPNAR